jgi:hypothetical protein
LKKNKKNDDADNIVRTDYFKQPDTEFEIQECDNFHNEDINPITTQEISDSQDMPKIEGLPSTPKEVKDKELGRPEVDNNKPKEKGKKPEEKKSSSKKKNKVLKEDKIKEPKDLKEIKKEQKESKKQPKSSKSKSIEKKDKSKEKVEECKEVQEVVDREDKSSPEEKGLHIGIVNQICTQIQLSQSQEKNSKKKKKEKKAKKEKKEEKKEKKRDKKAKSKLTDPPTQQSTLESVREIEKSPSEPPSKFDIERRKTLNKLKSQVNEKTDPISFLSNLEIPKYPYLVCNNKGQVENLKKEVVKENRSESSDEYIVTEQMVNRLKSICK